MDSYAHESNECPNLLSDTITDTHERKHLGGKDKNLSEESFHQKIFCVEGDNLSGNTLHKKVLGGSGETLSSFKELVVHGIDSNVRAVDVSEAFEKLTFDKYQKATEEDVGM